MDARDDRFLTALAAAVGAAHVLTDPDVTRSARVDWTGRHGGAEAVVVRPGSTAEVAAVLGLAAGHGVTVVPQGGNTGLVGGSVPHGDGALVVSTVRLDRLDPPDVAAGRVVVGAGVTPARLAEHLAGCGWRFAVDLGARDTATVGGMAATDAGGMRVFRHGTMRAQVAGLEYATVDGAVVSHLAGLQKDNTGYDLVGLICGSEGTLAVVTALCLRLVPDPAERATAVLGFAEPAAARAAGWALRRTTPEVEVVEYVSGPCLDLVTATFGVRRPVAAPEALVVEVAADVDALGILAAAVDGLDALGRAPLDNAVAGPADPAGRASLWRYRDDVTAALATLGPVVKYDVSVPAAEVDAFRGDAEAVVAAHAPDAVCWWFGHVCDDNLHLNVTGAVAEPHALDPDALDAAVLSLVAAHGGSISAEHGIGTAKAPYLHLARGPAEIARMRAIKAAFDPAGVLNPGVILA